MVEQKNFASRLTRQPIPFEVDRGAEAMAALPDISNDLKGLIAGAAGCSPFLLGLMKKEGAWLQEVLAKAPEVAQADLLVQAAKLEASNLDEGLRRLKGRAAVMVALADLGGVWDLYQVTTAWTEFADACVQAALRVHVSAEAKRGKIPGQTEQDALNDGAGMVALAMGKMGAAELNYSSDIDLICLFDETRFDGSDEMEARSGFVRATRKMAASLGENTAAGYVFRTDLRLRPDASVTPVCISMAAAERYYEAEGRNWERGAYIKARPAAGDLVAGARFLKELTPFVWRKHLDFAAIQDMQDMRQRIRSHKGLHGLDLEGHNIKLGAGGIREIEFFAQTRQLVSGGRDPDLRCIRTKDALAALAAKDWISTSVAQDLSQHYIAHREVEHRLQMINDAQTHDLPKTPEGFERLARFMGQGDTAQFCKELRARLEQVDALCEPFFAPSTQDDTGPMPELSDPEQEVVDRWPHYPALRSLRGQEIFERLKPDMLQRLQNSANPEEALLNFDLFLKGLPAGVQLFSLFEANPSLVDLLSDICATAPGLSRYLSRNAGVLDAVLGGGFFAAWPDRADLAKGLSEALEGLDYEAALDTARRWHKEWHFRVGVHHLRGLIEADEAGAQYTALADAVVTALWPIACAEIETRHGPAPGRGGAVLAMGSLGAGGLTAGSDLDLIVIYDAGGVEITQGRRPLDPRGWFAKATKTLLTALSVPTAEGKLYEVDMRLRPSGRQGPVATALEAFDHYQRNEAWTWEHMALTRARPLVGEAALLADIEAIRQAVLLEKAAPARVLKDAADMRARLRAAGRKGSTFEVKEGAGGLQDIDLCAQAAALMAGVPARQAAEQLQAGQALGWLSPDEVKILLAAHRLFSIINQAGRLLTERVLDPDELGLGGQSFLARAAGAADAKSLAAKLEQARAASADIIDRALHRGPDEWTGRS